jgi:hypothetical protein
VRKDEHGIGQGIGEALLQVGSGLGQEQCAKELGMPMANCEFSAFPPTDSLSVDADESGKCALRDAKLFS